MTSPLDMTLDDLIKQNKKQRPFSSSTGASRRHSTGGGSFTPTRKNRGWRLTRFHPYIPLAKAPDTRWEHDLYMEDDDIVPAQGPPPAAGAPAGGSRSAVSLSTKLLISNLHYEVSNGDMQQLFSEFGDLKRCSINYDRSGRSKGTAEVVFARQEDALAAVKKYDSVMLDGKPMKIEIVGAHVQTPLPIVTPATAPLPYAPSRGAFGDRNLSRGSQFGARNQGRAEGGNFSGRGGGWGRKGKKKEQASVSADDLDAELERYQAGRRH